MSYNTGSIGRGQQEWRGERSNIVFPTKLTDSRHVDKLGCARSLLWAFVFEVGICIAAVVGWSLWFRVH
jgi:hypothetical protein